MASSNEYYEAKYRLFDKVYFYDLINNKIEELQIRSILIKCNEEGLYEGIYYSNNNKVWMLENRLFHKKDECKEDMINIIKNCCIVD